MTDKTDTIFSDPVTASPFSFDKKVAEVFPDMIARSVPGYALIIENIESLARDFVTPDTKAYDLGCSLGAASLAMSRGIKNSAKVIGIDNSSAMLDRCQQHIDAFKHQAPIELQLGDVNKVSIENASMVVLNFTLQFIENPQRQLLLEKIYQGLNPGGLLVLSEKIKFEDSGVNQLMIDYHHQFKRNNGYSDLEISQKRNSLENVLIPDSMNTHLNRLKKIGFSSSDCWFQEFNFVSLIAIK